jgi:hypothetical protein
MYIVFIHPIFAYMGFDLEVALATYFESWMLLLFPCVFMSTKLRKPSDFFILVLALGLIVPMTSLYGLSDKPRFVMYSVMLSFVLICMIRSGRTIRVPIVRRGTFYALAVAVTFTIAVLTWLVVSGGFSFLNFSFYRVYELRGSVGELIGQGWFSYVNLWVFKVFNIFLFAYALHRKAWVAACAVFALQVIFFAISAHKAVLFYPLLILAVWFYLSRSRTLAIVPFGMFMVVVFSGLVWWIADLALFGSLFVRRVFFVTASNAYDYFDFFSANGFVFWSNSLTSAFVEYPYHLSPPELIGEWRGRSGHVNNTFIANGYMHAGVLGLLLYCLILGFLFRIIDSLSAHGVATWMGLAVTVIPVWSLLLSADLPTALMTHGLVMAVLLLFLVRGRGLESRRPKRGLISRMFAVRPH